MRHAFLVMAYNNYNQLRMLMKVLDACDCDIYLHIDSRSKPFVPPSLKHSQIFMLERMHTNWGGYSLVDCELKLLKAAIDKGYDYYHLMSGMCFPIKSMDTIKDFFEQNDGVNYIHFDDDRKALTRLERVNYYLMFQDIKPRGRSLLSVVQKIMVVIQKFVGVRRTKNKPYIFKSGSQWWSITRECAKFLLEKENDIEKCFKYTMCDEMFVQTMVYNSHFRETLPETFSDKTMEMNLRYIDWNRGTPYTFRLDDYDLMMKNDNLFVRKLDEKVDSEILEKLYCELLVK